MKKIWNFMTALVLMGFLLAACTPVTTATPYSTQAPNPTSAPTSTSTQVVTPAPKVLKVRVTSDPGNYDPAFWNQTTDVVVGYNIYQGLVRYDPETYKLVNDLADTITPSSDGLRIDFKLKEGIQFQGGYGEVTADDVKFSYERMIDPKLAALYAGDWATLDHVEVTGKYTGTIILKSPFAPLWITTLPETSGWILSKKYFDDKGLNGLSTLPIGTGPYQYSKYVPHQLIVLTRNPDYKGTLPEWDEIDFVPIPDDNAAAIALQSGELDFGQIAPGDIGRFENNADYQLIKQTSANYYWLAMNTNNPKLKDENIRQAIRYAVDVSSIIQAAFDGKFDRAYALIAPDMLGYWKDAPHYERDLTKAREYLNKAGVKNLTLSLTFNNSQGQDPIAAQVIQSNLADIGIKVELNGLEASTFTDFMLSKDAITKVELAYILFFSTPDPYWDTEWFTCAQMPGWNWSYMCDTQFDQLNDKAVAEMDTTKREQEYIQMQQIWDNKVNSVWVAYPTTYFAARKSLTTPILKNGYYLTLMFHN